MLYPNPLPHRKVTGTGHTPMFTLSSGYLPHTNKYLVRVWGVVPVPWVSWHGRMALTEVSGKGINAINSYQKFRVRVCLSCRTGRSSLWGNARPSKYPGYGFGMYTLQKKLRTFHSARFTLVTYGINYGNNMRRTFKATDDVSNHALSLLGLYLVCFFGRQVQLLDRNYASSC